MGVNSHEKLGDIISGWKVKRLLFLSDEGVASTEIFKSVESILKGNRVTLDIFTDIEPDPSDKTVQKAYELYRKSQPSVILALVGGWQKSH